MNDPKILANQLDHLARLASTATTEFEKAAVYAATRAIVVQFEETEDQWDGYFLEKLTTGAWHINAAVGYDVDNGHDRSHHVSAALGPVSYTHLDVYKRQRWCARPCAALQAWSPHFPATPRVSGSG